MNAILRTRLEQLEALIDAAPSPLAWVELCAALSEWPDAEQIELGIEFVRARMHAWPRADRTAPEWWRIAWEQSIPEPRLVLAGTLEGLMPAHGGGVCPVQYHLHHHDRYFYVRFRHDILSVTFERVGDTTIDRTLFEEDVVCIPTNRIGYGGTWSCEETHVMLSLISAAISRGDLSTLRLPESVEALRASEHLMRGPYPLLMAPLPEDRGKAGNQRRWSEPFQASNLRWRELADAEGPVLPAILHHLSSTRPLALGPPPAPSWSKAEPGQCRCELRLLGRVAADTAIINQCAFVDDDHVISRAGTRSLGLTSLRSRTCEPLDPETELAATLAEPEGGMMIDDRRVIGEEDMQLVITDLESGEQDRRWGPGLEFTVFALGPDAQILIEDERGRTWLWDLAADRLLLLEIPGLYGDADQVVFLADARLASSSCGLQIWDLQTGLIQAEYRDIRGSAIAARGSTLVVGDEQGELWLFETSPMHELVV